MAIQKHTWLDMPVEIQHPKLGDVRSIEAGEFTIEWAKAKAGVDLGKALEVSSTHSCPSPHWGYVIAGAFVVHVNGETERIAAGQVYYIEPGHTVEMLEDCEVIDISPTNYRRIRMNNIIRDVRRVVQDIDEEEPRN